MQVAELLSLTDWIKEHVERGGLEARYSALVEKLRVNTQPGQQRVSFQAEKEELFRVLKSIPLYQLSQAQIDVLASVGIAEYIGEIGAEDIEIVLVDSGLDIANALERIEKMAQSVSKGVRWANDMHPRLAPLGPVGTTSAKGDEVLVRIRFAGDAAIGNIVHLKKWAASWYEIGRGITMLHREKPEELRIVGASNGSVVVWMVTSIGVSKTLTSILSDILKIAERVLVIQKAIQEIRSMRLANDTAELALKDEIKAIKEKAVETIVAEAVENTTSKQKTDGELQGIVTKAVERLLEFSEKGGEVDFVLPKPEEGTSDELLEKQSEIRKAVEEVRKLESSVKQLELFKQDKS